MTAFQIFVNSYNGKTVTINNVTDGTRYTLDTLSKYVGVPKAILPTYSHSTHLLFLSIVSPNSIAKSKKSFQL